METINCIKTRRSIRKYSDKEVPDEIIKELIDCARYAPSSHNYQSWEFIIIRNKETKEKLSAIHRWSGFAKNVPVIIVICYDKKKCKFSPSDLINSAIAAENLLLAVHSMGLGACWIYIKDFNEPGIEQNVKELLNIPEGIGVLSMVPIGYSEEKPGAKELREIDEIIHFDKW